MVWEQKGLLVWLLYHREMYNMRAKIAKRLRREAAEKSSNELRNPDTEPRLINGTAKWSLNSGRGIYLSLKKEYKEGKYAGIA